MSNNNKWMPFYPGDYLRDTGHLSTVQHGAYLLLLMHAWGNDGALPVDDDELRNITRMDAKTWASSRKTLLRFFTVNGDCYRQKRIDRELARAQSMVEKSDHIREADAERQRRWRAANGGSHPPVKPNGQAPPVTRDITRDKAVTDTVTSGVTEALRHGAVTRATQVQPVREETKEESKKEPSFYLLSLEKKRARDAENRTKAEQEIGQPEGTLNPDAITAAQVRRTTKALTSVPVFQPAKRTKWEQIDAALDAPLTVAPDNVIPLGYKIRPLEPVRSVEEQKAWLEAEMARERGVAS